MLVAVSKEITDLQGSLQAYICINMNAITNIRSETYEMCSFHLFNLHLSKMENTSDTLYSGYEMKIVFVAKLSIN